MLAQQRICSGGTRATDNSGSASTSNHATLLVSALVKALPRSLSGSHTKSSLSMRRVGPQMPVQDPREMGCLHGQPRLFGHFAFDRLPWALQDGAPPAGQGPTVLVRDLLNEQHRPEGAKTPARTSILGVVQPAVAATYRP